MTRIKLKYCYRLKETSGKIRYVVRLKKGGKTVTIHGEPHSEQFRTEYEAAINPTAAPKSKGTFGALAKAMMGAAEFKNLKPNSQAMYTMIIDIVAKRLGALPVASMPRKAARLVISEIADERGPAMANFALSAMNKVFNFGIQEDMLGHNPFAGIKRYKGGKHHTWTDREIAIYESRWPIGTRQRLAMAVLLYTGQRGGDCVRIKRSDIRGGVIYLTQEKTGAEMAITVHPELDHIIRATPAKGIFLIGDRAGRPISQGALSSSIKRAVRVSGLPRECVAHGLRKAIMRQLAERGSSSRELKAVSGHRTSKELDRYTEAADQALLNRAAMARLKREE